VPVAERAVVEFDRRVEVRHLTPRILFELCNVATRPAAVNGLGLSASAAETKAADFEALFPLLPEAPDVYPAWKALVALAGVIGKQVHDARLLAVCHVHRVNQLLTFNAAHFAPLAGFGPGVVVVHPTSV